ncbi:MAG: hypothetical protein AB7W16_14845 [Candidatus Obscuribacterales bacterium]
MSTLVSGDILIEKEEEGCVVACITDQKTAWKVLFESAEQARARCLTLRLIICQYLVSRSSSPEETRSFMTKLKHAAESTSREAGIDVLIDTLDVGQKEVPLVSSILEESGTQLLVLTDSLPQNKLMRMLSRRVDPLVRSCKCSVMLVR